MTETALLATWAHGTMSAMGIKTPEGFDFTERSDGSVVITHHGKTATVLRGRRAADFIEDADSGDDQELMARVTGNYKHGNERTAKNHPRNR